MRASLRWLVVVLGGALVACATGAVDAGGDASAGDDAAADARADVSAGDAAAPHDAASDAGVEAAPFDAGCSRSDAGLGGIGVPPGTTATASASYLPNTADKAIDGDLSTYWNAGGYNGSLKITFAAPQAIAGLRVAATASPTTTETYTILGYVGATSTTIGSAMPTVPSGGGVLPPIAVTPGTYDAIEIQVAGMASWAAILEVSVLTANCP